MAGGDALRHIRKRTKHQIREEAAPTDGDASEAKTDPLDEEAMTDQIEKNFKVRPPAPFPPQFSVYVPSCGCYSVHGC